MRLITRLSRRYCDSLAKDSLLGLNHGVYKFLLDLKAVKLTCTNHVIVKSVPDVCGFFCCLLELTDVLLALIKHCCNQHIGFFNKMH